MPRSLDEALGFTHKHVSKKKGFVVSHIDATAKEQPIEDGMRSEEAAIMLAHQYRIEAANDFVTTEVRSILEYHLRDTLKANGYITPYFEKIVQRFSDAVMEDVEEVFCAEGKGISHVIKRLDPDSTKSNAEAKRVGFAN